MGEAGESGRRGGWLSAVVVAAALFVAAGPPAYFLWEADSDRCLELYPASGLEDPEPSGLPGPDFTCVALAIRVCPCSAGLALVVLGAFLVGRAFWRVLRPREP